VREAAGSKLEQVDLESVMKMMEMVMRGEKLHQPFGDNKVRRLVATFTRSTSMSYFGLFLM
jgi:hypothetical protein